MSSIRLKKRVIENQKKAVLRLGIASAALLLIGLTAYMSQDRVAPEMNFANAQVVYDADTQLSEDLLLKGITAADNKDGDLTDRIVIKNVHSNADNSIAVTYCVRDNAGNMTQETRVYNLNSNVASSDPEDDSTTTPEETPSNQESLPESEPSEEPTDQTEPSVEPEPETSTEPEPEPSSDEPVPESPTESEPPTEPEVPPVSEEEPLPPVSGEAAPVLQMAVSEVHIPVGTPFVYVEYIVSATDDLDDQVFLYEHIWIEGWETFDANVAGVYPLIYRVQDSNGNFSEGQLLTVYVE